MLRDIAWQIKAMWKLVASPLKDEWAIDDYPIGVRFQQETEPSRSVRFQLRPWIASVIHWPAMSATGNTKSEALEELRKKFDQFKATHEKLPRPGTKVPIEFAASDRVGQHSELAEDFVRRILEIDWAWISDESSLGDFHSDETNDRLNGKIREIYGVDVSNIAGGNLAEILDRIAKRTV